MPGTQIWLWGKNLGSWTPWTITRWAATLLFGGFVTSLIEENHHAFFEEYHLDKLWKWPAMLFDIILPEETHRAGFGAGFSLGVALVL